jgi:trehalose synthase
VVPGTGVLLDDPHDLDAFAHALMSLLDDPEEALRLGGNARRHVLEAFVGDEHLMHYGALMEHLKAL